MKGGTAKCIGFPIHSKKGPFLAKTPKFGLLGAPRTIKFGWGGDLVGILKSGAAIFEILIFWPVSGHTGAENSPFF